MPTFSLSSFTFIKSLFISSLLSAIGVVSSAYLKLLIFLPAILIPAYASSRLAFQIIYSAYKLNKQGDDIQPWRTPFLIWNQSIVPCPVLTVASSSFFKFYFIFKLYKIVLVLPNIKMNPPQVYMCSPSWTLLHPPSPFHPSGSSQCTSPKHPVSCIEPGLATHFIHILHVSMPFPKSSHPLPLPQSP